MAAGVNRLPPRLATLAVFSSPTPNPNRRVARPRLPPISISMDPALVDTAHLQALMLACAHSCAIRPSAPGPEPVDIRKLRTAVAHSFLVVSVFCGARFLEDEDDGGGDRRFLGLELDLGLGLGRRGEQRLVGFGRAVSDVGLTASVHDIVITPYVPISPNFIQPPENGEKPIKKGKSRRENRKTTRRQRWERYGAVAAAGAVLPRSVSMPPSAGFKILLRVKINDDRDNARAFN